MEPASVYSFSRSKYISANWSSSTIATLVSCGVEETNNSFDMFSPGLSVEEKATGEEGDGRRSGVRRIRGRSPAEELSPRSPTVGFFVWRSESEHLSRA